MFNARPYRSYSQPLALEKLARQCRDALARALDYLVSNFHHGWADFPTNRSGESTSWVTAHVLWQVGRLLPAQVAQAGVRELLSQRQAAGAWGFSQHVPADCDSTAHAIMALHRLGVAEQNLSPSMAFVLLHQAGDGGFRTYTDATPLKRYRDDGSQTDYAGWMQSHTCVTAVALEVLANFPATVGGRPLRRAVDFLIQSQRPEGYWESYWWTNKYFATTRILQQFSRLDDDRVSAALARGRDWLAQSQAKEGYWKNDYDGQPCPLLTAGCIKTLLATGTPPAHEGLAWLMRQQGDDGSWAGTPSLRIPPPHVKDPATVSDWRVGGRGVGSCSLDERRIYTTAAVAGAIHSFLSEFGDGTKQAA